MQRILDEASNGSAGYPGRHTERQSHELLLRDGPHRTNIWRGRSTLATRARCRRRRALRRVGSS
jgi:hypothetical protein